MTIAREAKLVVRELSPILAGFKLAAIVISYIGFGSVAKWFVEYWYPFTRKLWDWITASLSIPEFTVPVKDSLTALLFFLPLGLTAIYQCLYPPERISSNTYRAFAGILGILFFYLVTKDALAAFIKPDTQLDLVFDMSLILTVLMCLAAYVLHILKNIVEHGQIKSIMLQAAWPIMVGVLYILIAGLAAYNSDETVVKTTELARLKVEIERLQIEKLELLARDKQDQLLTKDEELETRRENIDRRLNTITERKEALLAEVRQKKGKFLAENRYSMLVVFVLLCCTVGCIGLAIRYAPRKLFVTMGAAIAFIVAAFLFEGFQFIRESIESFEA